MGYDFDSRYRSIFPGSSSRREENVFHPEPPDEAVIREPVVHQKRDLPPVAPFTAKATLRANLKPYLKERLDSERGAAVIAQINAHLSATKQPYSVQTRENEVCLMTEKGPEVVGKIQVDESAFNDFFYRPNGDPEENMARINLRFDIANQPGYKLISDASGRLLLRNYDKTVADIGLVGDFEKKAFLLDLRKGGGLELLLVKTFDKPVRVCGVSTQTRNAQECGTTVGIPSNKRGQFDLVEYAGVGDVAKNKSGYDKGTPSQPRQAKISDLVARIGPYIKMDVIATV